MFEFHRCVDRSALFRLSDEETVVRPDHLAGFPLDGVPPTAEAIAASARLTDSIPRQLKDLRYR